MELCLSEAKKVLKNWDCLASIIYASAKEVLCFVHSTALASLKLTGLLIGTALALLTLFSLASLKYWPSQSDIPGCTSPLAGMYHIYTIFRLF